MSRGVPWRQSFLFPRCPHGPVLCSWLHPSSLALGGYLNITRARLKDLRRCAQGFIHRRWLLHIVPLALPTSDLPGSTIVAGSCTSSRWLFQRRSSQAPPSSLPSQPSTDVTLPAGRTTRPSKWSRCTCHFTSATHRRLRMCRCLLSAACLSRPFRSPRGPVLACIHLASSAPSQVPRPAPTVLTPELASPSTQTTPRCRPPRHAHGTTLPSPRAALPHSRAGPPPRCPGTVLPSTTPTLPCVPRTAAPRSRSSSSALPCSPLTVSPLSHRNCPPFGPFGIKLPTTPHWCSAL